MDFRWGKAYVDTGIGASIVRNTERYKFDGYLQTAAIDVVSPDNNDKPYKRPNGAYMILPAEQVHGHRSMVGDDWIASAITFEPRMPYYGNAAAPPAKGHHNAQLWFATGKGIAGWMISWKDDTAINAVPRGYVSLGDQPVISAGNRITAGKLNLQVVGNHVTQITPFNEKELWVHLSDNNPASIPANTPLGYGMTAWPDGESPVQMTRIEHDSLLILKVATGSETSTLLLYNPTDTAVNYASTLTGESRVYRCHIQGANGQSQQVESLGNLAVNRGQLVVIPGVAQ